MDKFYSIESVFGNGRNYYNEDGQFVGYSIDSVFGNGQNIYDADGQSAGYSVDSIFGNGEHISLNDDAFDNADDF